MAISPTPAYAQAINLGIGQITNALGTGSATIFTAGANGSLIQSIGLSSTDTSNQTINFFITRSATNYLICTIQAPLSAGNATGTASVDVMRHANWPWLQRDMAGNPQLRLKSGDTLTMASTGTITAGKLITVIADGEDL